MPDQRPGQGERGLDTLASCSQRLVVNNRICASSCPAGHVPNPATGYCGVAPASTNPHCSGVSSDAVGSCCTPEFGLCTSNSDCSSASCRTSDGICQGVPGDPCSAANDCTSGSCKVGYAPNVRGAASNQRPVRNVVHQRPLLLRVRQELCTVDTDCCTLTCDVSPGDLGFHTCIEPITIN